MRVEGEAIWEIAEALGVSYTTAHEYIKTELARCQTETAGERDQLREIERARLETVLQRMMALAARADIIIETDKEGARGPITITVEDYTAATKAADALVKISARLADLYGLNAPVKQELSGSVNIDNIATIRARMTPKPKV